MSKADIQSWISSTHAGHGGDGGSALVWRRDRVLQEWSKSLEVACNQLMSSSTKSRVYFLQNELLPLARLEDLTLSQIMDIFRLLTLTLSRYHDSQSQDAVDAVGRELVKTDEARDNKLGVADQIIRWLSHQASQISQHGSSSSYAPSDLFVLFNWVCGIYDICIQTDPAFTSNHAYRPLVTAMALLYDSVNASLQAKPSLKHGAVARARRVLRKNNAQLNSFVDSLLDMANSKTSQGPIPVRLLPLLGVAIGVLVRLKDALEPPSARLTAVQKEDVISLLTTHVLMSKTSIGSYILDAFQDFIVIYISPEDMLSTILPALEKAILRSPEVAVPSATHVLRVYPKPLSAEVYKRSIAQALNVAKSSNASVRAHAVELFEVTMTDTTDETLLGATFQELVALPRSGKTSGPDHRVALYTMLGYVQPCSSVSTIVLKDTLPLLVKETHEQAIAVLATSIGPHLAAVLHKDKLSKEVATLLAKEMAGTQQPRVRKAVCGLLGSALWTVSTEVQEVGSAKLLGEAIFPALENILKAVSGNPLSGVPLEGYVAIATLFGPLSRWEGKSDRISHSSLVPAIIHPAATTSKVVTGSKQSFLLWDKVYHKVTDETEATWLLRATSASLKYFAQELRQPASDILRIQFGLIFVHLVLNSPSPAFRNQVYDTLSKLYEDEHVAANVVLKGLLSYLQRETQHPSVASSWLLGLLTSVVGPSCDIAVLKDLFIVAHHPEINGPLDKQRQAWIGLCQRACKDPQVIVSEYADELLESILDASQMAEQSAFPEACCQAIRTLVFVSPTIVLPKLLKHLEADLDAAVLTALTDEELGIWQTPEGTMFLDVLSLSKTEVGPKKGKDYEISKWESELRKSLASKKTTPATLTKQQQALVNQHLGKEAAVRQKIDSIKLKARRGLFFTQNAAHALKVCPEAVSGLTAAFVSNITSILLRGALLKPATLLVGQDAFDTYISLANVCSSRLETFGMLIGVATLRASGVDAVPNDFQIEDLGSLISRVLYRVRFLSEQSPFDATTFSYIFPLVNEVIVQKGISVSEADDVLEQMALVLDIIRFHVPQLNDKAYPRTLVLESLIRIMQGHLKLTKEASSALVDMGQIIYPTVTKEEADILLQSTLSQEVQVRNACLQTLQPFDLTDLEWSSELWIACHDSDEQNAKLSLHAWEDNGLDVPESFLPSLIDFLGHDNEYVRSSVAASIAEAVEHWPSTASKTICALEDYYREKAKILAPEFDQYGMVIAQSLDRSDPWPARLTIARIFELLTSSFPQPDLEPFFKFLIEAEALGDREAEVRRAMLSAGIAIIDTHGKDNLPPLISMFESHLASPGAPTEAGDHIKEAVVILFGRLASHLDPTDSRIPGVVDRLKDALKTPSEQVQIAVSECLSPLVKVIGSRVDALVEELFDQLLHAPSYAVRRGTAYGLAGVIHGTGIGGMKKYDVVEKLQQAAEDKHSEARQGVMFAFETMSSTLKRLFEPYIIFVLPLLLSSFGDATPDVREATQDAARVIMQNLSGYGVKLILPSLLSGLEEKQWRTKKGSIELLGMMAYCSPRQLSLSLPIVIPRLTDVLTDSHAQVRSAANKSLKQFGEVISNPEIQSLVPVLLKALVDPSKTSNALSTLLKTSFMHFIDHSSLALLLPIIERGLKERGAETKKKAAQIVGNLASLTDSKDFVPYLPELLPLVHVVLVDPVPEARATAAKALGTLVERLGEDYFPDLVPGLLRTLKTDTSGVDRQGAAQGLSEVLSGLGMERLEGLLPDIISNAQSPRPTVREGFMSLLMYLPATFGVRFQPHLPKIISPILSGLADTDEYVREASMRAGRMVVTNYSSRAVDLLLPELEQGLFDPGWRIRQSSITLVGELLFKVSGISGKTSDLDEEDTAVEAVVAESSRRALVEVLGAERRDHILAALYVVRQDSVLVVRTASIQIWKALVHNTPRTVRDILPKLMSQIIALVSSDDYDQQETAGRTIAEICRRFGERLVGEMMPMLRSKLNSPDSKTREGVCLTLSEVMQHASENQREGHEDEIISIVRVSLVDDEPNVRSAAAKAFDVLQEKLGTQAIDATIPTLLEALRQPGKSSGTALQALREVMSVRATTVFPVLIPTLTAIPMTIFNARALASLIAVAGEALSRRITTIINALVKVLESDPEEKLREAATEALRTLFQSIDDAEGLNTVMMILLGWTKHESPRRRVSAYSFFAILCDVLEEDASLYRVDWIRQLVSALEDREVSVHAAAWNALDVLVKSIPKDELELLIVPLRRSIESTGAPGTTVPGFSLPKGLSPFVPVIIAGLTTGSNEQREQAAYAIGDLVERTEETAMKPFVVPFTGPLIRVATQATTYPPGVKTAILSTLMTMLERIPVFIKPFFPQLQRTFVKSASDPSSAVVRTRAAQALGALMKHQPRVDPVVTELISGAKSNDDTIASSLVMALAYTVRNAAQNVGEKAREAAAELATEAFSRDCDEQYIKSTALLISALGQYSTLLCPLIQTYLVGGTPASVLSSHAILAVLEAQSEDDSHLPNVFENLGLLRDVAQKVQESTLNEKPSIARPAREARELLKALGNGAVDGIF
ncbi:translational activator GCN1 [Fistulina hepatica ATCC 64428]|nr:translational activator GCN1 [Fistulina hepatica ATCC 64428]